MNEAIRLSDEEERRIECEAFNDDNEESKVINLTDWLGRALLTLVTDDARESGIFHVCFSLADCVHGHRKRRAAPTHVSGQLKDRKEREISRLLTGMKIQSMGSTMVS